MYFALHHLTNSCNNNVWVGVFSGPVSRKYRNVWKIVGKCKNMLGTYRTILWIYTNIPPRKKNWSCATGPENTSKHKLGSSTSIVSMDHRWCTAYYVCLLCLFCLSAQSACVVCLICLSALAGLFCERKAITPLASQCFTLRRRERQRSRKRKRQWKQKIQQKRTHIQEHETHTHTHTHEHENRNEYKRDEHENENGTEDEHKHDYDKETKRNMTTNTTTVTEQHDAHRDRAHPPYINRDTAHRDEYTRAPTNTFQMLFAQTIISPNLCC